jgi:NAD(P)-dependent dehydrogenase (short-subunit alcohol dehydrogenase family)
MSDSKTAIVTGAQQGIGAGLVEGLLNAGYNVVGTSLAATATRSASSRLLLVDGDISKRETAERAVDAGLKHFGSVDLLVNNAGVFYAKPFLDFTADDFNGLASVNLLGFLYITQLAVRQMLLQKSGSVVTITAALADNPMAGVNASVSMITKGGLNTVTRQLAMEYAKHGIRFNAVAPGVVDTPLHENDSRNALAHQQPMGRMTTIQDVVEAVLYLADARQVTGEVLHVDGGAHVGRW